MFLSDTVVLGFETSGDDGGNYHAVLSHAGFAVLAPTGMTHEFWAEENQYGEFILIMFGQGS